MSVLEQSARNPTNGVFRPMRETAVARASRDASELPFGLPEQSAAPAERVAGLSLALLALAVIAALLL